MKIEVAAHRGNRALFPENTMPALQSAFEIKADMVETDIHMTKDGELVIFHDWYLHRVTNNYGSIHEMTWAELKNIDVGIKHGEQFEGLRMPRLGEFLDMAKKMDDGKMQFNFEFKDYFHKQGEKFACESADKIIKMIDEYGFWDRAVLNSFDGRLLEYIDKKYDHRFRLHGYYPFDICMNPDVELYCACPFNCVIDGKWVSGRPDLNPPEDFEALRNLGIHIWGGAGLKTDEDILKAIEYGVELFTSDEPQKMMDFLKEHGYR